MQDPRTVFHSQNKTTGGGGGSPSVGATCTGHVATGDATCVFSSIGSGSILLVGFNAAGATALTVSGCSGTWTTDTLVNSSSKSRATGASSGSCTVTVHVTAGSDSAKTVAGIEITSTSAVDVNGAIADQGFVGTGSTINCPAITTTVSNDLVAGVIIDYNGNGTTFTAGSPATIAVQTSRAVDVNIGIETYIKAAAGSTTPTFTYDANSSFDTGSIAFKP